MPAARSARVPKQGSADRKRSSAARRSSTSKPYARQTNATESPKKGLVDKVRNPKQPVSNAELADVLEAVLWERAKPLKDDDNEARPWQQPAKDVTELAKSAWPSSLCSRTAAKQIGLSLTVRALEERFRKLADRGEPMDRIRAKAVKAIAEAGQLALPPPEMALWNYFKSNENTVVNKGSLAAKQRALQGHRTASRKRRLDTKDAAHEESPAKRTTRRPSAPPTGTTTPTAASPTAPTPGTVEGGVTIDEMMQQSEEQVALPGLLRGSAAGITYGRGRGGAIQRALKVAVRDLVVEDHVPIRDVPKVMVDVMVAITQQMPLENQLITHSAIAGWICELSNEDLLNDWAEFWSVRHEFGSMIVLHVAHDGSRRPDRKLGRHGELMQYLASYFNPRPEVNRAVEFPLSFRFTVGGSAAHTARALAVNLADGGVLKVSASLDPTTPFKCITLHKGVLFGLGADNTGSAINVSEEMKMLTGEPCGLWPCPTHINALDGKTPIFTLTGDAGKRFDDPNFFNIGNKWWYVCDKHLEVIEHWWPLLQCGGKAAGAVVKARPLMGKWESVGAAHDIIYRHADGIRKFVVGMEYHATSMAGLGSLKQDCKLLGEWLHNEELWFHFLVCHDWFTLYVDPTFVRLRSRCTWIHPESGCHMGRQVVPRLALNAICRTYDLPDDTASDVVIDTKAKQYIPNAHAHVHLSSERAGSGPRFEITSQDRRAYLRDWASKFTPQLRVNAEKHWRGFLRTWKVVGLVTDPELGVFVARHLVKLVTKSAATGGEPSALGPYLLGPTLKLHVAEINRLMAADGGTIAVAIVKEDLFESEARKAEWVKLCALPPARSRIDWTRKTLPELAPWFESRFFGAHRCNYPREQGFSVWGQHVESEQSAELKEAIVRTSEMLQPLREARRAEGMRVPKKGKKAQERYLKQKQARQAEGKSEELTRDSENRKQLLARAETLLERMSAEKQEAVQTECIEIGKSAAQFGKDRKTEWDKLYKREPKALEGEMRAKRAKGKAKQTPDPYGRGRKLKQARKSAAYLAAAEAANEAEVAASQALKRSRAAAGLDEDGSDEDEA